MGSFPETYNDPNFAAGHVNRSNLFFAPCLYCFWQDKSVLHHISVTYHFYRSSELNFLLAEKLSYQFLLWLDIDRWPAVTGTSSLACLRNKLREKLTDLLNEACFFFFASCSVSLQNCSNHLFYFRSLFCVTQRNNIFFCSMVPNFEAALKWLKALVINWNVNQSTVIVICLPKKAEALFIFSSWHLEYNGLSIKWLAKINQRSNWLSFVRIDQFAPNILWTAEAAKQAFSYRGQSCGMV